MGTMYVFHMSFKISFVFCLMITVTTIMFRNCSYCNHQTKYKANLKTRVKNIHGEKMTQEKDMKNLMKNEHYKQLKKIEMMMKKNFKFGVEIDVLKKNVESSFLFSLIVYNVHFS